MSKVSYRYASSLFESVKEEDKVLKTFNVFSSFINIYEKDEAIKSVFNNPIILSSEKKEIINNIINDKFFKNFLNILIDQNRINELSDIFKDFKKLYYELNNILVVSVTSASVLNEETKTQLVKKLENKFGKTIILETVIDESIIGGLILRSDDVMINLSIKEKLNDLKSMLKQTNIV